MLTQATSRIDLSLLKVLYLVKDWGGSTPALFMEASDSDEGYSDN
jgi:hypothetical protein